MPAIDAPPFDRPIVVWHAASRGAIVWSTFGLIESGVGLAIAGVLPMLVLREPSLGPLTLLAAPLYPVMGALLGAIAGAVLAALPDDRDRWPLLDALLTLSIPIALSATLIFGDAGRRSTWLFTAGSIGLGLLVCWRLWQPHRLLPRIFGDHWFISLLSLGLLHIALAMVGRGAGLSALRPAAVFIALVVIASLIAAIVVERMRMRSRSWAWKRVAAAHATAWAVLLLVTIATDGGIDRVEAATLATPPVNAPNILLITMDTVRGDHVSADGYARPTTPRLAALAQHATLYTSAFATGNMTLTTHGSMFTGRYASSHQAVPPAHPLPLESPTLASLLAAAGYRTAAVVSNRVYLHPSMGLARGFQFYDYRMPDLSRASRLRLLPRDMLAAAYARATGTRSAGPVSRRATEITEEAVRQIESSVAARRPFFLFLNYMDTHAPYVPPSPFDARFASSSPIPLFDWNAYQSMKRDIAGNRRRMSDAERTQLVDAYDGGLAYIDDEIGRVLDVLRTGGLLDRTLVIVTADHGEAFDEHGIVEHASSLYEHQVHVPLIVKMPGQQTPSIVREPVSGVDLMPTVLEVAGQTVPATVQGWSLARIRTDRSERYIFAEDFSNDRLVGRAAIDRTRRKLMVDDRGHARLFDLAADPGEQRDVIAQFPVDAAVMRAAIEAEFASGSKQPQLPTSTDPAVLERLRSLGYVK
jgi:arylsulfatase A-like enzyme